MAVYYVATNGDDTNAGTSGAPFKTLKKARDASSTGDKIIVKDGTYVMTAVIKPKSNQTWQAQNKRKAKLNCNGAITKAFSMEKTGANGVTIDGFEVYDSTGSGIAAAECDDLTIINNYIHHCPDNGIGANQADRILIEGNLIHDCATMGSRSGITVLMSITASGGALSGAYGIIIRGNVIHHCGRMDHSDTDGNGIILDKLHWNSDVSKRYGRRVLVTGNYVFRNGGDGIRDMATENSDIFNNTVYGNRKNKYGTGTFIGEIAQMYSSNNKVENNIAVGVANDGGVQRGGVLANHISTTAYKDNQPLSGLGNSWANNVVTTSASGDKVRDYTTNSSTEVIPTSGYTNANPLFVGPMPTDDPDDDNYADPPVTTMFALDAGSPALRTLPAKNIGAWQSSTTPVDPNVTVTTAPEITASDKTSGKGFTFTAGTYSATVTKTTKAQAKVNGVWTDLASSATSSLTVLPTVTASTQFRIVEVYTGTGVTDGENPSAPITVNPAVVVPPGSRKTPKFVAGSYVCKTLGSGMTIPSTYKAGTLIVGINQVTQGTAQTAPAPWINLGHVDGGGSGCSTAIAYQIAAGTSGVTWGTWGAGSAGQKVCWQFEDAEIDTYAISSPSGTGTSVDWPALTGMTAKSLVLYSLYTPTQQTAMSFPPSSDFIERTKRVTAGAGIGTATSGDTDTTVMLVYAGATLEAVLGTASQRTYALVSIRGVEGVDPGGTITLEAVEARVTALELESDGRNERLTAAEGAVQDLQVWQDAADLTLSGLSDGVDQATTAVADFATRLSPLETTQAEFREAIEALQAAVTALATGSVTTVTGSNLGALTRFLRAGVVQTDDDEPDEGEAEE